MRCLLLVSCFMIANTTVYATSSSHPLSTHLQQVLQIKPITPIPDAKNDIAIVYGGKDISLRPTLAISKTTV